MLRYQINKLFLVKVSLQIGGFGEKIQSRSINAIKYYMSQNPYFSCIYIFPLWVYHLQVF